MGRKVVKPILYLLLSLSLTTLIYGAVRFKILPLALAATGHRSPVNTDDRRAGQTLAFPEAEGFGAIASGGRGGRLIAVTSLANAGPGSLREALAASGPRLVVFRTGGTIQLDSPLVIANPDITVAGQTAPGGGITIRNRHNHDTSLKIRASNVIIRYLTIRPGPHPDDQGNIDAIGIVSDQTGGPTARVMIDHVSASWSTDEIVQTWYTVVNTTVQWSLLAEALYHSTHPEYPDGEHSTGMLLGSDRSGNFTVHHNLFAHNAHRNPQPNTDGLTNIYNNLIYNSGGGDGWDAPIQVKDENGVSRVNVINNLWIPGPNSGPATYLITGNNRAGRTIGIYAAGNQVPHAVISPEVEPFVSPTPIGAAPTGVEPVDGLRERVLEQVGNAAMLQPDGTFQPRRDPIDHRIIEQVRTGTGSFVDSPEAVGGYRTIAPGTPYPDSDQDGMADAFERKFGLDPHNPADGAADADADGYTNVEEFFNGTRPGQERD